MTDAYREIPPAAEFEGEMLTAPGTYIAPAVSVRATWSATDGSKPEEVYVDWKEPPPPVEVIAIVQLLLRGGARVERTPRVADDDLPLKPITCTATADLGERGDSAHYHRCKLTPDHEPIEPEGRAHRCGCGGLFAADIEVPDVVGQRGRGTRDRGR